MSTSIEWTDETWNPTTGCSKVSQGCKNCYAERLFPKVYPGRAFTDVRCHPDRLDAPLRWKKPRMVFANSMSDLFHEDVPSSFIDEVFETMNEARQHTFQILTKRPQRMRDYFAGLPPRIDAYPVIGREPDTGKRSKLPLPNIWLGVSVEDQATADERIPLLLQTPAAIRFVSYEPALGPVDLVTGRTYLPNGWCSQCGHPFTARACGPTHAVLKAEPKLDWVICGGESGPKARPMNPNWAWDVQRQCEAAGVAFFFKQWGEWVTAGHPEFGRLPKGHVMHIREDGTPWPADAPPPDENADVLTMKRVGKARAGRELYTGREFSEYPERHA